MSMHYILKIVVQLGEHIDSFVIDKSFSKQNFYQMHFWYISLRIPLDVHALISISLYHTHTHTRHYLC